MRSAKHVDDMTDRERHEFRCAQLAELIEIGKHDDVALASAVRSVCSTASNELLFIAVAALVAGIELR